MKKRVLAVILLCAMFVISGCQGMDDGLTDPDTPVLMPSVPVDHTEDPGESENPTSPSATTSDDPAAPLGSGEITYGEEVLPLTEAQEALVLAYFTRLYEGLARLETPDFSDLFIDPVQAEACQSSAALQIGMRTLIDGLDYSLTGYSFQLICQETAVQADGTVSITATLESVENFTALPGIDSRRTNFYHHLELAEVDGQWQIQRHASYDSLYGQLLPDGAEWDEVDIAEAYTAAVPAYLEMLQGYVTQREAQRGETVQLPAAGMAYDSAAALAYADQYAMDRNPEWADYSSVGGNCQNFVSQCLYAGGIPMDTQGDAVWKWYGSEVSNAATETGCSMSWASVTNFRKYVEENTGFGLVAVLDAPYYSGQPGDVIQMGTEDGWEHTVIVRSLVANAAGETVDYLICSNTNDMANYPVSLYGYPVFALARIVGWNQA